VRAGAVAGRHRTVVHRTRATIHTALSGLGAPEIPNAQSHGAHGEARPMFVRTAHGEGYGSVESSRRGDGTPTNKAFELTAEAD
jgi:hypothetical protein